MSILVTGAGGFIGSALCKSLLVDGYEVVGLVRKSYPDKLIRLLEAYPKFRVVVGDIRWADKLTDIIENNSILTVFHLAAQLPYTPESPDKDLGQSNAIGTAIIANVACQSGVKEFIYGSSISVYSAPPDCLPVVESHPTFPRDVYGKTKLIGEIACAKLAGRMTVKIVRYAGVYGVGCEKNRVIAKFVRAALSTQPLMVEGDGLQSSDFIPLDDVIYGTILVWREGQEGIYNIGSGRDTSLLNLAKSIKHLTSSKSEIVFSGKADRPFRFYLGIDKVKQLGYMPVTIEDGLRRYIRDVIRG